MGREGGKERFLVPAGGREKMAAERERRALGLAITVFTPPHHESDEERDEADGGYDHGQEHVLWGIREGGLHHGAVGKVDQVSLEDDAFRQGVGEAQPELVCLVLQAILQVAVIPGEQ